MSRLLAARPPSGLREADLAVMLEVRAALLAAASPHAALVSAIGAGAGGQLSGHLAGVVADLRLGRPLAEAAAALDCGDPAAELLVRALAVAEQTGTGATTAVEQALGAAREEASLRRLLDVRSVQARGSTVVLTAVPVLSWALLVATDPATLAFYGTLLGAGTLLVAALLVAAGQAWSRRLIAAAVRAAADADPLRGRQNRRTGAIAAAALPALLAGFLFGSAPLGLVAAGVAAGVVAWRRRPGDHPSGAGGAAETAELLAVALASGLSMTAAIACVAPLAPPAAGEALATAARRLAGQSAPAGVFDGTGLEVVGAALAASLRWGAPAEQVLRQLAADLRADRRAAAEAAAERTQLMLIFPTTLLTLPAFVLAVVPPLLWSAFAG